MLSWAGLITHSRYDCGRGLLFSFLSIFWLALSAQSEAFSAVEVRGLRLGEHPEKSRIVLDISKNVAYSLATLADPYRIVIDLPDVEWTAARRSASTSVGLITGYRFGLFQPGNSRLVLDLSGPAKVKAAYFLPAVGEAGKNGATRLVIDIISTDRSSFLASSKPLPPRRAPSGTGPSAEPTPHKLILKPPSRGSEGPIVAMTLPPAAIIAPRPERAPAERDLPPAPKPGKPQLKIPPVRTVVVDAGHGGVDPGAITNSGVFEKGITLDVARRLGVLLGATGRYRVLLTRDRDIFVRLAERVAKARDSSADLFISIHADSIDLPNLRGASVYTLSEQASDKEAEALADKENSSDLIAGLNIGDETDEIVRSILIDLAQRETMNKSVKFAKLLLPELRREGALLKNSHRFAGFRVLKAPDVPSVLVELGLLSNRYDAQLLTTNPGRQKLAGAIKRAVDFYFRDQPG